MGYKLSVLSVNIGEVIEGFVINNIFLFFFYYLESKEVENWEEEYDLNNVEIIDYKKIINVKKKILFDKIILILKN